MLTKVDFNRLRVFYLVYEKKSIQAAAQVLNVTRSAISQHLSTLEDELGFDLFVRSHKVLIPTNGAHELIKVIAPFLTQLDVAMRAAQEGLKRPSGLLRIGAPAEIGTHFLAKVMAAFRSINPEVRFELKLGTPPLLCELLLQNKIDFGFIDAGDVFEKLYPIATELFLREEQILVCSKEYYHGRLQGRSSYQDLLTCDFVSHVSSATEIKFWFKHHFRRIPGDVKISLVCEHITGLVTAVCNGMGLGLIPKRLIKRELASRTILNVNTGKSEYINKIMLVQLPDKKSSLTEKTFLNFCRTSWKET